MKKGDIVLVPFPFTNLEGQKRRPAVLLNEGQVDAVLCFITSKANHYEETDFVVEPSAENGLKKRSLVKTSKIATLHKALILGRIGSLGSKDIRSLDEKEARSEGASSVLPRP